MEDSGLDDVWAEVYARNSLRKMMEGKSYSKTLRACLLTDAALHNLLMSTDFAEDHQQQDVDDISDYIDKSHDIIVEEDGDDDPLNFFYDENMPFVALEEIISNDDYNIKAAEYDLVSDSQVPSFVSEEVVCQLMMMEVL